nr:hypothetical protein [Tanacetum cinerariifolium]
MDYCCSKGSLRDKIICDLNKTPDLSQRPPKNCPKCGNHVDGHYCQGCALLRKKFKEDLYTYCIENGILQDFQDTFEPSYNNTNVVNALQDPFSSVENLVSIPSESEGILDNMFDVPFHDNSPPLNISKDQFEDFSNSNDDSTSIDGDSFSIDNVEYVEVSPLDYVLVSLEVMDIVILKVGGIDDDILLTIKDDILSFIPSMEKILEIELTFENKHCQLEDILGLFRRLHNDVQNIHEELAVYINTPNYEAFYDDHVKEISIGSTTTHSEFSLYDSFIFNLSINLFPHVDRSDFYEFAMNSLTSYLHQKYDCFRFTIDPNSRDFTKDVVENISPMKEPQVLNILPTHPTLQLNMKFEPSSEYLFAYVVWIFLPFLVYSVVPCYLLSL